MSPMDDLQARQLRSRARLLEFLKFRVLASQEAFFEAWRPASSTCLETSSASTGGAVASLDLIGFRHWLHPLWPEAAVLSDADLRHCLEQAHNLYVDPPVRGRA